jgi:hypothetical protein
MASRSISDWGKAMPLSRSTAFRWAISRRALLNLTAIGAVDIMAYTLYHMPLDDTTTQPIFEGKYLSAVEAQERNTLMGC